MNSEAAPPPRRHKLTRTDYHRMAEVGILAHDARVELIDGEIIDMPPIGPEHGSFVSCITHLLVTAVSGSAIVWPQNPIVMSEYSEPEPDFALLRPRVDFYLRAKPETADVLLLIEVSVSSLAYDRNIKGPLYARHGIPVYWVLDLNERQLLRHEVPSKEGYRRIEAMPLQGTVPLPGLDSCSLDLSALPC